ncbi:hypothetical protein SAMN05518672_11144 [Chitinophaga sp. CF118]|uniref:hypothetical protein n=1 Tax=Chitinophaga sp. CF118 TaxID=1884367 RepID=UPI0008EAF5FA|nr:hypothetical protein [Chitinophaga sp. CF118]SFE85273.1 hypothetical protein SAMN05518672_11144 [Chitinophaga sp. CF118]
MTINRQLAALYVMAACILGCKQPTVIKIEEKKRCVPPETDTMIAASDTVEPIQIASWQLFERFDGKYALETGMLEKEPLKTRISQLLGKEEVAFTERFDVTPPVEVEGPILYNQGCRRHYCGTDEAAIAVDMNRDLVYVGISVNGIVKLYGEKHDSTYPQKLLRWKQKFPLN